VEHVRQRGHCLAFSRSHIKIVEQISRRDEAGARAAMENVIRVGRERVRIALKELADVTAPSP
jgi:DNA-binding FadR family transcriptional regulator